jgi:hypothetical protein
MTKREWEITKGKELMYLSKHFITLVFSFTLGWLFSAASLAAPAIWEAQIGPTVTDTDPLPPTPFLDDTDDADTGIEITFGDMTFPFDGTDYNVLSISSNGLISLGGSNGSDPEGDIDVVRNYPNPSIAPLFTDLDPGGDGGDIFINRFDDDDNNTTDRIVITYATGMHDCTDEECSVLAQVQLFGNGAIIFGYNGVVQTTSQTSPIFVGISEGDGADDPGETDFSAVIVEEEMGTTIYEEFAGGPTEFDLDDSNIVFIPSGPSSYIVISIPSGTSSDIVSDILTSPPEHWESAIGSTLRGAALDNSINSTVNLTFGSMRFPFAIGTSKETTYTGTNILNISSNGFISLGGSNGSGCENDDPTRCGGEPTAFVSSTFPWIAPFWTDLSPGRQGGDVFINRFNDDFDPEDDRIVVTFVTGFSDCAANECSVLTQVQLLEDGTIIFGYNGVVQTDSQGSDILVGVTPGSTITPDPGNTDLSKEAPFNSVTETTVYEVFLSASAPPFDLDGGNVVFEPNGVGGYQVTTPGIGGKSIGGSFGGGGGGGCSLTGKDTFDPTLWLLVLIAAFWLKRHKKRRHSHP